jgi:hypothetical protein
MIFVKRPDGRNCLSTIVTIKLVVDKLETHGSINTPWSLFLVLHILFLPVDCLVLHPFSEE